MTFSHDQIGSRTARGAVYQRCGCTDREGRRTGASCPRLGLPGHGSWYWTVELGRNARRRRRRRGGYASRQGAQQALTDLVVGQDLPARACLSTGEWLHSWLARRQDLRPSTRRMYASHLNGYLLPGLGKVPLAELSAVQIRRMVNRIVVDHERTGRGLKPATLVRILATLRAALNGAVREQFPASPA